VHSGTASSMRVRGTMPPSYNVIDFDEESVRITLKQPGKGTEGEEPLASFSRTAVTTSEFYPDFERFVLYDRLPFLKVPTDEEPG
jgi:3',5'-cyclic-AMP phosphodiesterase